MKFRYVLYVLLTPALLMLLCTGCGYRFAGSSSDNLLVSGQTVWVEFPQNITMSQSAQTHLKRSILEEFHARRGMLPAATSSEARYRIDGKVRSVSSQAVSYTAADLIREYRLILDVEMEAFRKENATAFWKGALKASQIYPAAQAASPLITDLARQRDAEEAALVQASREIARKLIESLERNY